MTIQEIPAGYKLGSVQTGAFTLVSSNYITYEYGTPTISDDGTVGLSVVGTMNVNYQSNLNDLKGKFCRTTASGGTSFPDGQVIFIPGDAVFSTVGVTKETNKYQPVTGYPKTPAGTTTTYPVSTNPNAYQEGSDAKPAGYTLGEVETGKFKMSASPTSNTFYVNSTIAVTDAGTISFPDGYHFISVGQNSSGPISARDVLGNFMSLYQNKYDGDFEVGDVWFIPSDATITDYVYVTKRQRVTGYAAIPAGTTIEYLGKLGDKARVQVVSYVGTGTYGSSNPNSLTFDFVPKAVFLFSADTYNKCFVAYGDTTGFVFDSDATIILHVSWDGKNISWFNTNNDLRQHNVSGYKYRAIAIG